MAMVEGNSINSAAPSERAQRNYMTILPAVITVKTSDGRTLKHHVFATHLVKRRITNIANRFELIKGELNAQQTMQGLRDDMRDALSKFCDINEQLWPLLEAAEVSAADRATACILVNRQCVATYSIDRFTMATMYIYSC